MTDADLDAFYSTLPEGGAEIDRDDFAGAARFMRYHLEREIALQAWGTEGQFDHSWRGDRQITTAVEMLRRVSTTEELLTAVSAAEIRQNQDQ